MEGAKLLAWLRDYVESLQSADNVHLFPSYADYRKVTNLLMTYFLGPKSGYTLHGLRGAGATLYYLAFRDVPSLQKRGRWASDRAVDIYVQIQAATIGQYTWSAESMSKLHRWASRVDPAMLNFN